MSKAEILEQLPQLAPAELGEIWERLWELEERGLVSGPGPTEAEKRLLDREMEDYRKDPDVGAPWPEVEARLRARTRS